MLGWWPYDYINCSFNANAMPKAIITARIAEGCASKIFGKPSAKTGKVAITGDLVSPRFKTLFAGFLAIYWPYFWPFLLYTAGGFLVKMAEILYI